MSNGGSPGRRWLWPLLTVSLMVNFLVLGAVAGAFVTSRHGGWGWHGREYRGISAFLETLPHARKAELGKILADERKALEPLWSDLGRARRDLIAGVADEPFDRAKLDAMLLRFGEAEAKTREGRMRKFAEIVSRMTSEERRAFRDWRLEKHHGWWRRKHHHDHGGGEADRE